MTNYIVEPVKQIPVAYEADLCVIGGSCTGVFAAIAAARLGACVAIVESMGFFGGTATTSSVCVWHTLMNTTYDRQIIGGLTLEMIDRLRRQDALIDKGPNPYAQYVFLPAEMIIELDRMVVEAKTIRPFLHTRFVAPVVSDAGHVDAVIVEDKSGRRAIRARVFIDASGDADIVHRMGLPTRKADYLQPPTTCAVIQGLDSLSKGHSMDYLRQHVFDAERYEDALPKGHLWTARLPGDDMSMVAGTRVHGADCSDADQLTQAEIEGRRQVRNIMSIMRRQPGGERVKLHGIAARIGIRETRHAACLHQLTEREVLHGTCFFDGIMNGSYSVDVHLQDEDGTVFRFLDGTEKIVLSSGERRWGRWREEVDSPPTFYQLPYRSLVPQQSQNVLVAGRCVDADPGAFGAVRVMVNTNQMGHAAGIAAWLVLNGDISVADVDTQKLRAHLERQEAVII